MDSGGSHGDDGYGISVAQNQREISLGTWQNDENQAIANLSTYFVSRYSQKLEHFLSIKTA